MAEENDVHESHPEIVKRLKRAEGISGGLS